MHLPTRAPASADRADRGTDRLVHEPHLADFDLGWKHRIAQTTEVGSVTTELFPEVPYWQRIALVAAVIGISLSFDLRRPRGERIRWRAYSFLVGSALVAALFGVGVDTVTSSISRDYFILFKGIPDGDDFIPRVLALGAQAGVSAGVVLSGLWLLVAGRPEKALDLFRSLPVPLVLAALGGVLGYGAGIRTESGMELDLSPEELQAFHNVWCVHVGVYAGALAGAIGVAVRLGKSRWRGDELNG